jgi:hypothetical protein
MSQPKGLSEGKYCDGNNIVTILSYTESILLFGRTCVIKCI